MHETIPSWVADTTAIALPSQGIEFAGVHTDFASLARRAEALGAWMAGLSAGGIGKGDVVALYLPTRMEIPLAHLATMSLGAVTLPLNTAYTGAELAFVLTDARARLVITDAEGAGVVQSIRGELNHLRAVACVSDDPQAPITVAFATPPGTIRFGSESSVTDPAPRLATAPVEPDDGALILYTSGTTGRPKGAQLTHRNITANLSAILDTWRIDACDRFLLTLPLFHAHGLVLGLHSALFSGCLTVLQPRFHAEETLRALVERRCTLFMGVPTYYYRLLQLPQLPRVDLSAMRLFTSGSAPLDSGTWNDFRRRTGHGILERYGLSETLFNSGNPYDPAIGERIPGTVGLPFPGVEISIRGTQEGNYAELSAGAEGEIWVRGANIFKGYLGRPDATREAMHGDWFRTGDLGRLREDDGYLEILGRAKDLIITGGYNVYPKEVETVLNTFPGVAECAVVGKPSAEWGETVHAVVVKANPAGQGHQSGPNPKALNATAPNEAPMTGDAMAESLIAEVARHLARFKVPRSIEFVETLPRNAMGKVQKQLLRERLTANE